jgi:hypothetical protein
MMIGGRRLTGMPPQVGLFILFSFLAIRAALEPPVRVGRALASALARWLWNPQWLGREGFPRDG